MALCIAGRRERVCIERKRECPPARAERPPQEPPRIDEQRDDEQRSEEEQVLEEGELTEERQAMCVDQRRRNDEDEPSGPRNLGRWRTDHRAKEDKPHHEGSRRS